MPQLFNSRDKNYKSKYGAVECGETLTFRLLLPFFTGAVCYSARMIIRDEFTGEEQRVELLGTDQYDGDFRWWECHYTAAEKGLYWYHFEYDGPFSTQYIYRGSFGNGVLNSDASDWQLTVYEKGFDTPKSLKGATIYQIFPDRFSNSGKKKTGVPKDRELVSWDSQPKWRPNENGEVLNQDYLGGDLAGIQEKLPYLKNMGVSIIYLNPIFEAHSNHRYNTANYEKIDPLLGTEQDFVSLCKAAHELDIKIILDGVFNHTGDDSIYFNKKSRYPTLGAYNSKESPYFDWYRFGEWPDTYESWWGFRTLPDVNETNPDYVEYITGENGIIAKWLRLGADGWRLDVADELPDDFIRKIHTRAKSVKPDAIVMGEVWEDASNKIAYSERRQYLLGDELDSVMNYPFANAILQFLRHNDAESFMEQILTVTENYPKPVVDVLMNLLGTHDTERILTRLVGESCEYKDREWQSCHSLTPETYEIGIQQEMLAAILQYTLPGIPSVYYGDEAGMEGYKDPFNRAGFPWDNIRMDLHSWYVCLGRLRQICPVLKEGQFVPVSGALGCVCYARIDEDHPDLTPEGDALVVIANNNPHPITYHLPEALSNTTEVCNVWEKNGNAVTMPARSAAILGRGTWIKYKCEK